MVTFFNFIFSSLFIFSIHTLFFLFSLVFSPPHMYPHFSSLSSFLLFIFYFLVYLYLQMSLSNTWTKNTKTCHSFSHHIEEKSPLCSTKGEKNSFRPLSLISRYCGLDFFFFLNCYNFISFMRKTMFCDQIAFCILFIQCLGVFVAVEVEINAEILIYCVKFFIWIYSSVDYFKWEKWFGVATVFSRSRELLQQLQKKREKFCFQRICWS